MPYSGSSSFEIQLWGLLQRLPSSVYRAHLIGYDDRTAGFEAFEAADDRVAIAFANGIGERRGIELWWPRFITKIRPKPE